MIKKHFALLAICLFFIAIITSACGGGGKTLPPSYPFIPVPTPTPIPTPTPTPEKFPLELSQTEFTLNVGATDNIIVTLNGEDITQTATYTVDQEAIANVEQGAITGLSPGVAIVTVNAENAEEEKTFTVNVIDPTLPTLEVSPSEVNLFIEEETSVTVTLNGEDVTEQVDYKSDDELIATAEKGIIVKAQDTEGTAKIAVSLEGANSTTITVNVNYKEVTLDDDVLNQLGYEKVKNNDDYYDIKKIEDGTIVTNLEIPAIFRDNEGNKYKITCIGERAFYLCTSLKNITIPNSVTTIGDYAFNTCNSLESVTIGNSVTTIEEGAFSNCYSLKNITIGNSVTTIEDSVFASCQNLKSVTIPNSVTTIGDGVFADCQNLKSVTIPNSVTTIGANAFGYSSLENVTIPSSVTTIGEYAFYEVENINISEEQKSLPNYPWGAKKVNGVSVSL